MANVSLVDNMENNVLSDKEFTKLFISIYRDMPMLWEVKSKDYTDKHKRSAAIRKMTNLLRMERKNITEGEVKKKINILRTSFRRENNKVKKSMLSGAADDDVYVPSLWYYNELQFLQDQVEGEQGMTIDQEESSQSSSQPATSTPSKRRKKEDLRHDLMLLARDHFKNPESECQVMARNWTFKLERMSVTQRRLAEKFINDILFEGEEGNLHRDSVTIHSSGIEDNQYYIHSTPSPVSDFQ